MSNIKQKAIKGAKMNLLDVFVCLPTALLMLLLIGKKFLLKKKKFRHQNLKTIFFHTFALNGVIVLMFYFYFKKIFESLNDKIFFYVLVSVIYVVIILMVAILINLYQKEKLEKLLEERQKEQIEGEKIEVEFES